MPQRSTDHARHWEILRNLLDLAPGAPREKELQEFLESVRPEDAAELLTDLSAVEKISLFEAISPEQRAEVLDETDENSRNHLVETLPASTLLAIVRQMPPDEATDLIDLIPIERRSKLLDDLDTDSAREIRELMQHDPESAGGIMTSQFIAVHANETAQQALETLQRSLDTEVVSYVYVIDDRNRLEGVISIREIIAARPEDRIRDFMEVEVIAVRVDDDQEEVANLARKYNLNSIPVIDADQRLVGVATIDDIVDVIIEEADEDIYKLAGTAGNHPSQVKVFRRAMIRIPWLLFPALAGFVVAFITGQEGETTEETRNTLALFVFVPLVMGVSGGVGTQSSTMMARGLATGEIDISRMSRVLLQELIIGSTIALSLGIFVALLLFGAIEAKLFGSASSMLPSAVGIGLAVGIVFAAVAGTVLPLACHFIGLDPALVAGPFVTGLNDVAAAFSYLTIGHLLLA